MLLVKLEEKKLGVASVRAGVAECPGRSFDFSSSFVLRCSATLDQYYSTKCSTLNPTPFINCIDLLDSRLRQKLTSDFDFTPLLGTLKRLSLQVAECLPTRR